MPMETLEQRKRIRLANLILGHASRPMTNFIDDIAVRVEEFAELTKCLRSDHRRWSTCQDRGWSTAARQQAEKLTTLSRDILNTSHVLLDLASRVAAPPQSTAPTLREILGELRQLDSEFDQIEFDAKNRTITARTEPITLDNRYLGPFEIVLKIPDPAHVGSRMHYKVVATDPHPASTNEHVTHPHVRDEELCEGDAAAPIRQSLANGRVCDFFCLVRSVLGNYNAGSPYVALDDWDGVSCYDCGSSVEQDDLSYCDDCHHDVCSDCGSYCRSCDNSRCLKCLEDCEACGDPTCSRCRSDCAECESSFCNQCLEDSLCPACREKAKNDDLPDPSSAPAEA
jgi:hypothetical protein